MVVCIVGDQHAAYNYCGVYADGFHSMDFQGGRQVNAYTIHQGRHLILETGEQRIATWLGKERRRVCKEAGLTSTSTRKGYDQIDIEIHAAAAEISFAKMANVMPDLTTGIRRGGVDCYLVGDIFVDVKHTKKPFGRLMCHINKTPRADLIFVLMRGEMPKFTFAGWQWSDVLIQDKNIITLEDGTKYYQLDNEYLETFL